MRCSKSDIRIGGKSVVSQHMGMPFRVAGRGCGCVRSGPGVSAGDSFYPGEKVERCAGERGMDQPFGHCISGAVWCAPGGK